MTQTAQTHNGTARDAAEIGELLGHHTAVTLAGKLLNLRPMTFGQLPKVLQLISPLLADLDRENVDVTQLVLNHADRLVPLAALLTGETQEWVDSLPLDDAADLVATLIEVNADFFARRVLPRLSARMDRLAGMSKSSAPAATTDQTPASGPVSSVN
ncbi:MAG: DUF6631 family protein [Sinimarinibacterium flocculans]|uniref:DUF6631 family protein n=1 Tax=Sinimarinibacterium flocculans TaxID=985250 RepID=UPI003C4EABE0